LPTAGRIEGPPVPYYRRAARGVRWSRHKYVTTHWNPLASIPVTPASDVGREGVTTTDLNLRPVASARENVPIGLAESGSKVKVLSVNNNWYEVLVVEHARPKTDPYSSDRGWVNKSYIKFD
jgi:SH3 domain-containing protein